MNQYPQSYFCGRLRAVVATVDVHVGRPHSGPFPTLPFPFPFPFPFHLPVTPSPFYFLVSIISPLSFPFLVFHTLLWCGEVRAAASSPAAWRGGGSGSLPRALACGGTVGHRRRRGGAGRSHRGAWRGGGGGDTAGWQRRQAP